MCKLSPAWYRQNHISASFMPWEIRIFLLWWRGHISSFINHPASNTSQLIASHLPITHYRFLLFFLSVHTHDIIWKCNCFRTLFVETFISFNVSLEWKQEIQLLMKLLVSICFSRALELFESLFVPSATRVCSLHEYFTASSATEVQQIPDAQCTC